MNSGTAPDGYSRRVVDDELDDLMSGLAAVSLEGPKGVGKTATARMRAATAYELDDTGEHELTTADPARLLSGALPILIDEWQRYPASWDLVRRAVDADPSSGRFILTGSAAPVGPSTHSGAGRIVPVRMRPLSLAERGFASTVSLRGLLDGRKLSLSGRTAASLDTYVDEILASGFPAIRPLTGRSRRSQLDGYLQRVIDREFPEQGFVVRHPDTLTAWMRAYAAATATTASFEAIRDAATAGAGRTPAKTTTLPYRDVLSRLWLLDPVLAWLPTNNRFTTLGSAPKHQLADPALAARLLGATADTLLSGASLGPRIPRDGTLLGALFDSLNALNLRVYAQACEAHVRHLRTHRGEHEVDYIVVGQDGGVVAVEVKLTAHVGDDDVEHLHWLHRKIGDDLRDAVVITTGTEAYRRQDGIAVVPAALLGP